MSETVSETMWSTSTSSPGEDLTLMRHDGSIRLDIGYSYDGWFVDLDAETAKRVADELSHFAEEIA